jgi:hypothetical protein
VYKGDEVAAKAGPGLRVDHLGTAGRKLLEGGGDVADADADVVHAGPATLEKTPHVRVFLERGDELDPAASEAEVGRFHALLLEPPAHLDLGAEERSVRRHRRVEILDRESDVVH